MNKKANIFGKKIPVFVIALIAVIGLVSAALVPYLSGLVTGTVTANSPLTLGLTSGLIDNTNFGGATFGPSVSFGTMYGGGQISMTQEIKNLGTNSIPNYPHAIVTNPSGVTCADFSTIQARTQDSTDNGGTWTTLPSSWTPVSCVQGIDANTVVLKYGSASAIPSGLIDLTQIQVVLNVNTIGTYTYSNQFMAVAQIPPSNGP